VKTITPKIDFDINKLLLV